jgi:hypothetical protein
MINTRTARTTRRRPERAPRSQRSDDANAFFPDPGAGPAHTDDEFAENMAENFLESATSGEDHGEDAMNAHQEGEDGGPFVATTAEAEFALDTDASNPPDAEAENFPTPMRAPRDD